MRKMPLLGTALLIPALSLCMISTGCNKPTDKTANKDKGTESKEGPAAKPPEKGGTKAVLTAPTDGIIKGVVKINGPAPTETPIAAIQSSADKATCLAGSESEKVDQMWLVNKSGSVANVLVYLEPPADKSFDLTKPNVQKLIHAESKAILDQPHCAFVPHVLALYAGGKKGGMLEVKNDAPIVHNTKIVGVSLHNPEQQMNLQPKAMKDFEIKYQGKDPVQIACSQHAWMNAKLFTFNQPYFAVTKEDGSFEINDVPTGVELTVMMWHESFGPSLKDAKDEGKKTFKAGDNSLELKISGK